MNKTPNDQQPILPVEEKTYPIGGYAPGPYQCQCTTCKELFFGDKMAIQCEPCAVKMTAAYEATQPILTVEEGKVPMYENLYGKEVTMNDRFETKHIWSEALAIKNNGKWIPELIVPAPPERQGNKTAMQELIYFITDTDGTPLPNFAHLLKKANDLLEKEQQQLTEAFVAGGRSGIKRLKT